MKKYFLLAFVLVFAIVFLAIGVKNVSAEGDWGSGAVCVLYNINNPVDWPTNNMLKNKKLEVTLTYNDLINPGNNPTSTASNEPQWQTMVQTYLAKAKAKLMYVKHIKISIGNILVIDKDINEPCIQRIVIESNSTRTEFRGTVISQPFPSVE
ncbi:MAG: hypothetical protein WC860_04005 [Candidatus Margulisiibacteriota bacterium]|jgi:hypothetical protein